MKRLLLSALCAVPAFCIGQTLLYNDGAIVKVQAGATLYVEGGIQNTATGTIDNDGTIEVKGNFLNAGTWEPSQPNTLKFSGNVNSDVTPGSAVFQSVIVQKDATFNVNLLGAMTVNTNLDFNSTGSSKIITNNFDLKMGSAATVTGYDADEYVATTGTGMMEKAVTANGTFIFPIGDGTNYSPLTSTYTGSGYTAAKIRTKANDLTHPNKPADATEFISRYWDVDASGITGYSNTLTGTYIPADLTLGGGGTADQVKGAVYDLTPEWSYAAAASGANIVTGSTNDLIADFTGTNFFGKVNIMAFLQGPFSAGAMSIALNTGGLIPTTTPYSDAPTPFTPVPTPANVTDWVKLELRDATNPATVLGRASAFIKNNGAIVGLDGTSLPVIKNGNPSSIVAVVHRNHLPFRTNVGLDCVSPVLEDFTVANSKLYDNTTDNAPLNTVSGKFVMWPCDASGATFIVNSTDLNFVKSQTATTPTGYLRADVNLNGAANSTDLNLTKSISAVPKTADL